MIKELGLSNQHWKLFSVNDNAANVKLGIRLSQHLKKYSYDIHTLELAVKETFKPFIDESCSKEDPYKYCCHH